MVEKKIYVTVAVLVIAAFTAGWYISGLNEPFIYEQAWFDCGYYVGMAMEMSSITDEQMTEFFENFVYVVEHSDLLWVRQEALD